MPTIVGIMTMPLLVADCPRTNWKKRGMKMITPNIPMPMPNRAVTETATTRSRKMCRGMIGSLARDSATRKTTSITADAASDPMTCGEPQS